MDAATGEVSEAGLERAEVVLLEADLAASTALDIVMAMEWRWGGGCVICREVEERGRACSRACWGVWGGQSGDSQWIRCWCLLIFAVSIPS